MVASELLLVLVNNFNCILNIYHDSHVKNLLIRINVSLLWMKFSFFEPKLYKS